MARSADRWGFQDWYRPSDGHVYSTITPVGRQDLFIDGVLARDSLLGDFMIELASGTHSIELRQDYLGRRGAGYDSGQRLSGEVSWSIVPVPEPSAALLVGLGLLGLSFKPRR